jgi:hypothetical protein
MFNDTISAGLSLISKTLPENTTAIRLDQLLILYFFLFNLFWEIFSLLLLSFKFERVSFHIIIIGESVTLVLFFLFLSDRKVCGNDVHIVRTHPSPKYLI